MFADTADEEMRCYLQGRVGSTGVDAQRVGAPESHCWLLSSYTAGLLMLLSDAGEGEVRFVCGKSSLKRFEFEARLDSSFTREEAGRAQH